MAESNGYLLLSNGSIHSGNPPKELHVLGKVRDGRFSPQGDVVGDGSVGAETGTPGWMELADGSFHSEATARPPFPPYIKGYRTPKGEFRPGSRRVNY